MCVIKPVLVSLLSLIAFVKSMGRKIVQLSSLHPYHVTARTNNQDWFDVNMDYVFGIFTNVSTESIKRYNILFHSFVLMDNHFHMIVSTPDTLEDFSVDDGGRAVRDFTWFFLSGLRSALWIRSLRLIRILYLSVWRLLSLRRILFFIGFLQT